MVNGKFYEAVLTMLNFQDADLHIEELTRQKWLKETEALDWHWVQI